MITRRVLLSGVVGGAILLTRKPSKRGTYTTTYSNTY